MDDSSTNNSEIPSPAVSAPPTKQEEKSVKKNSKLIAILACATILIVMAVLLILYVMVWSKPSKEDFKLAYTEAKSLEDSYDAITDTSKQYTTEIKNNPDTGSQSQVAKTYSKAVTDHQAKMKVFADRKALRDEDVKKVYDTFIAQDKKALDYTKSYIGLQKSLAVCVDIFGVVKNNNSFEAIAAAHKKEAKRCTPILKDLESSSVKVLADYAKGFDSVISERQKVLDSVADGSVSSEAGADKINELGAKFKIVSNVTAGLIKARDDSSVVKPLRDLETILQKKTTTE